MPNDDLLKPLKGALCDLATWLTERQVPYAIIGGVAVSLQGNPRATEDIDGVILIDEARLDEFLADAAIHGFPARVADPVQFARRNRILLLVHAAEGIGVDLSLGILPFEQETIARAAELDMLGCKVRVARVEELIAMKVLANRSIDVADVASMLELHPKLDFARIQQWVQFFADSLDDPEIAARAAPLLDRRPKPRRSGKRTRRNE